MIRVTVTYPKTPDSTFDMGYYLSKHMPMLRDALGGALLRDEIWTGVSAVPEGAAAHAVVLHMYFESADAFSAAFGPHAPRLLADIPSYTNVSPLLQIDAPVG